MSPSGNGELLRAARVENVQFKVHVDAAPLGGYLRKHLLALLDSLGDQVITLGLLTETQLGELG